MLEFLFPGEKKENYQRNFSLKNLPTSCCLHPYIFPANKCYDNIYVQSKNPLRLPIVWINLSHPSHDLSVKHTAPCDVYWLTQCVTPSSCGPILVPIPQGDLQNWKYQFYEGFIQSFNLYHLTTSVRRNQSKLS